MPYKQTVDAQEEISRLTRKVERCERIYGASSKDMQQRFADDPSLCPWDNREIGQWMADLHALGQLLRFTAQ